MSLKDSFWKVKQREGTNQQLTQISILNKNTVKLQPALEEKECLIFLCLWIGRGLFWLVNREYYWLIILLLEGSIYIANWESLRVLKGDPPKNFEIKIDQKLPETLIWKVYYAKLSALIDFVYNLFVRMFWLHKVTYCLWMEFLKNWY